MKQCETFLLNQHISYEVFSRECLPSVLLLARDKVPNIRIAIAKLLKDSIMQCGQSWGEGGMEKRGGGAGWGQGRELIIFIFFWCRVFPAGE